MKYMSGRVRGCQVKTVPRDFWGPCVRWPGVMLNSYFSGKPQMLVGEFLSFTSTSFSHTRPPPPTHTPTILPLLWFSRWNPTKGKENTQVIRHTQCVFTIQQKAFSTGWAPVEWRAPFGLVCHSNSSLFLHESWSLQRKWSQPVPAPMRFLVPWPRRAYIWHTQRCRVASALCIV